MPFDVNPLVNRQTGMVPLNEVAAMSGMEFFKAVLEGRLPPAPISAVIPLEFLEFEEGRILLRGEPKEQYYNPIGSVHGGYHATLLDTAMACAIHTTLLAGQAYTTLEFKIAFHRPVLKTMKEVRVEGKILSRGQRAATSEGFMRDETGKLLASGTTTCLIYDMPKAA
jgi:uncharacterized protein (TIGR00369 family)